jgi:aminopeptidase YwaD
LERQPFDCHDWQGGGASLTVNGVPFEVFRSPHSLGCEVQGTLVVADTLEGLQSLDARAKLLLLRGEIAATQLMPTNFPYYYPDEHRAIYDALLAAGPAAILTATSRCPEIAGAQ